MLPFFQKRVAFCASVWYNEGGGGGRAEGRGEGRAEGREEGRAEGELNKAMSVAREMKKLKMGIDVISQVTGLSESEINSIE